MVNKLYLFCVLFICFGCSGSTLFKNDSQKNSIEYVSKYPEPLPDYIGSISYSMPENFYVPDAKMCISLKEDKLWQTGDTADALFEHLVSHTVLSVNGDALPRENMHFSSFGMGYSVLDNQNQVIGTHGGILTLCATPDLGIGTYLADLQITTTSGEVKSYAWVFKVE